MDAVQHFEIPYKVRERAKKFYFDAFHWQFFDVPGTGYTLANTVDTAPNGMPKRAGAINGGLTPRGKDATAPTVLMHVTDIKSHLERIRHHGGTVLSEPVAMGPVWYARFKDTEGNVLGVIQDRPEGQEPAAAPKAKSRPAKSAKKASGKGRVAKSSPRAKPAKGKAAKAKPKARKAKAKKEPKAVWSR